jgi:hypothetical protein
MGYKPVEWLRTGYLGGIWHQNGIKILQPVGLG